MKTQLSVIVYTCSPLLLYKLMLKLVRWNREKAITHDLLLILNDVLAAAVRLDEEYLL